MFLSKSKAKAVFAAALCSVFLIPSFAFADDGDEEDDFFISMDEDFSESYAVDEGGDSGSGGGNVNVLQGLWIEATSDTTCLIRDIATGEKNGYEIDKSNLSSYANWWFWGDLSKTFHLDAEISTWNFDKALYQANSYAANVPTVTLGDGAQSLAELLWSFLYNGNDDGVGSFNKMGFNINTPYVNLRLGYGGLQNNGMSEFKGIYNVIDRWLDVGKGYTEITNGKKLQKFGDVKLNAVAAFSQMRGTYGLYDILDAKIGENYEAAATFGSYTTADQLFFYNTNNINAASLYLSGQPLNALKLEAHGLGTFGTSVQFGPSSLAAAGRVTVAAKNITAAVTGSYAGENADSVWGSDGQIYDDINADTYTGKLDFELDAKDFLTFYLDENLTLNDVDDVANGKMTVRSQPMFDFDLEPLAGFALTIGGYGVVDVDRLATATSTNREIVTSFQEAGVEIVTEALPFAKKLTADWAIQPSYNEWESGNSYTTDILYNSVMLAADINDKVSVHFGGILRSGSDDATVVPFGLAAGVKVNNTRLLGHPHFWAHISYGMNPYSENNYSLYRADNWMNKAPHRTYLLDTLESDSTSHIGFGLIWDLQ